MRSWKRTTVVVTLCLAALALQTVETAYGGEKYHKQQKYACSKAEKPCILKPLAKLHRGFTNVVFSWFEIPRAIQHEAQSPACPCLAPRMKVLGAARNVVTGLIHGTINGAGRALGGATEMVLFPIPPYKPAIEPPTPLPLKYKATVPSPSFPCLIKCPRPCMKKAMHGKKWDTHHPEMKKWGMGKPQQKMKKYGMGRPRQKMKKYGMGKPQQKMEKCGMGRPQQKMMKSKHKGDKKEQADRPCMKKYGGKK